MYTILAIVYHKLQNTISIKTRCLSFLLIHTTKRCANHVSKNRTIVPDFKLKYQDVIPKVRQHAFVHVRKRIQTKIKVRTCPTRQTCFFIKKEKKSVLFTSFLNIHARVKINLFYCLHIKQSTMLQLAFNNMRGSVSTYQQSLSVVQSRIQLFQSEMHGV